MSCRSASTGEVSYLVLRPLLARKVLVLKLLDERSSAADGLQTFFCFVEVTSVFVCFLLLDAFLELGGLVFRLGS